MPLKSQPINPTKFPQVRRHLLGKSQLQSSPHLLHGDGGEAGLYPKAGDERFEDFLGLKSLVGA